MFRGIGKCICAARNIVGMSQDELAVIAGLSRPTINRLESGNGNARIKNIEKMLNAFNDRGLDIRFEGNRITISYDADMEAK